MSAVSRPRQRKPSAGASRAPIRKMLYSSSPTVVQLGNAWARARHSLHIPSMNRQTRDTLGRTCLSTGARQSQSLAAVIVSCNLQGISRLRNTVAARAVHCIGRAGIGIGIGSGIGSGSGSSSHCPLPTAHSPCARPVDLDTVSALSPATHWRGTHITLPAPPNPHAVAICATLSVLRHHPAIALLSISSLTLTLTLNHTHTHHCIQPGATYYTKCSSCHVATYCPLKKPPWIPSLARPLLLSCTTFCQSMS